MYSDAERVFQALCAGAVGYLLKNTPLAQLKAALGDLDKIARVVRLGGFINSAPGFPDGPKVMNGASDLMVAVFGDKGRHARTTVGVAALPLDAAVEVEAAFEAA